jgi:toxin ParE1/3/4
MKPMIFHEAAEDEFRAAVDYYNEQRAGLGSELVQEGKRTLARIAERPGTFTLHGSEGLPRFPYAIYYLELEQFIWIAAIAHHRRRPDYWKDRSPNSD